MNQRIALSYAGEDRLFVEYTAGILETYLGPGAVFHYTSRSTKRGIRDFLNFVNAPAAGINPRPKFVMVCFTRRGCIVEGQRTELLARNHNQRSARRSSRLESWQDITNSRTASSQLLKTVEVTLPSHGLTEQKLREWSVDFDLGLFGQSEAQYGSVTDMDCASAEQLAEFLLRDILDLGPQVHSCKAFTYEKDVLEYYAELHRQMATTPFSKLKPDYVEECRRKFNAGVPLVWPSIRCRTDLTTRENKLAQEGQIGSARTGLEPLTHDPTRKRNDDRAAASDVVIVAGLSKYHGGCGPGKLPQACLLKSGLHFLEAGPRARILDSAGPRAQVGILVSGGIAPGINAVIDGIVRRHEEYDTDTKIYGFKYGLRGLSQPPVRLGDNQVALSSRGSAVTLATAEHVSRGGSVLGTFRLSRMDTPGGRRNLQQVLSNLKGLDVLYVIGGDGSMKAANLLATEARKEGMSISIVGIPKTMDNDILWVWQSFGFATAVEKAREIIDCLSTEVESNPRVLVVQLFGSVSGFVVSHAVLSAQPGQCDAALIPEAPFKISKLAAKIRSKFEEAGRVDRAKLPKGMIVMAETAIPEDADAYLKVAELTTEEKGALRLHQKETTYLDGQTSDDLRSAGLKLVVRGLEHELKRSFDEVRMLSNQPRHILRASSPSFSDIIFGQRLGALAVDNAMAGYSDFMVRSLRKITFTFHLPVIV